LQPLNTAQKEAFDAMKKDPDNFKKRVAEFYAGKK
jgi:hypothetical protein